MQDGDGTLTFKGWAKMPGGAALARQLVDVGRERISLEVAFRCVPAAVYDTCTCKSQSVILEFTTTAYSGVVFPSTSFTCTIFTGESGHKCVCLVLKAANECSACVQAMLFTNAVPHNDTEGWTGGQAHRISSCRGVTAGAVAPYACSEQQGPR